MAGGQALIAKSKTSRSSFKANVKKRKWHLRVGNFMMRVTNTVWRLGGKLQGERGAEPGEATS